MSTQPAVPQAPAAVTYLETVRDARGDHDTAAEQLRQELASERNANKALLSAIVELDGMLSTERSAGRAMLTAVSELERRLTVERDSAARWRGRASEAELLLIANAPKGQFTGSRWRRLRLRLR